MEQPKPYAPTTHTKGKRKPDHRDVKIQPFTAPEGKQLYRITDKISMYTTADRVEYYRKKYAA